MDTTGKLKYFSNEVSIENFIQNESNLLNDLVKNNANPQILRLLASALEQENAVQSVDIERESPIHKLTCSLAKDVRTTVYWMAAKEESRINVLRRMKKSSECEANNYLFDVSDNGQKNSPEDFDFHDHIEIKNTNGVEAESSLVVEEGDEDWEDGSESDSETNIKDNEDLRGVKTDTKNDNPARKYPCEKCGHRCPSKAHLHAHERTHLPDDDPKKRPFICAQCGKAFTQKYYLREHALSHSQELPFPCNKCHKEFSSSRKLRIHAKAMHSKDGRNIFKCETCEKKFFTACHLRFHEKLHLEKLEDRKPFQCDSCGLRFRIKSHLRKHSYTHSSYAEKPFGCDECDMKFIQSVHLRKHKRIHSEDLKNRKLFACDQCEKKFSREDTLKSHSISHLPDNDPRKKKLTCDICSRVFSVPSAVQAHVKSFLDEYPQKNVKKDDENMTLGMKTNLIPDQSPLC